MTAAAASRRGDNRELVALARGGGLNFIGAAITQLTTVGLLLYMTRDLSKSDVGLFRISVALFELLKIVALVGLGQAMTRYVAVFRADRDRAVRARRHPPRPRRDHHRLDRGRPRSCTSPARG